MKIKDVVHLKPIVTVIDFQSEDKSLIDGYVVMDQTARYFSSILEGFTNRRSEKMTDLEGIISSNVNRCHKITGTYGVGKSYFILMLKSMLEALKSKQYLNEIISKFQDFEEIVYHLEILRGEAKKYIIVDINGKAFSELNFKSVIERQVYHAILKEVGVRNLNFDSFYEKSANQLIKWRNENTGMYRDFEDNLQKLVDYSYNEMLDGLTRRDNEAREKYIKVYEKIMGHEPSNNFDTLKEFLEQADTIARNNGFDGIVILFDEFSTYLLSRAETGYLNSDLSSIDILAESTMPSEGKRIHFITTEHEDIEIVLEKIIHNTNTIKKTAGRFKNYNLKFEKGTNLLKGVLEKSKEKFDKIILENSNEIDRYNSMNNYAYIKDIYPFNPYTLEYLVRISEQYAQGDRTLFGFIDEDLRRFVAQNDVITKDNKLNLIGIDTVFDCFSKTILKGREEFTKSYNIQNTRANNNIEKRIVKALALDYAVTITDVGKIRSGINDKNIKYVLSLTEEETKKALNYLHKEQNDSDSYIVFNEGNSGYELSPDVYGINIEEEIRKELNNTNEIDLLDRMIIRRSSILDIKSLFVIPKMSRVFPFDRKIEGGFIKTIGDLDSIDNDLEPNSLGYDGKILFFIPMVGQSYDFNLTLEIGKQKVGNINDNRIIIAIPKTFTFANEDVKILKRYEALERLTKNENVTQNPKAQNILRIEIVKLRTIIYNKLSEFGRSENFIYIFKDEILDNINCINEMIINWLTKKVYPQFPTMEVEDFSTRNSGNQLINRLIIPKSISNINLDDGAVFFRQIRGALKPLELVKVIPMPQGLCKVELKKPPSESKVDAIFKILEQSEKELSIKEKYLKLVASPYGLNDTIFEVLFAIFMQINDKYYLLNKDGSRVSFAANNIEKIWEKGIILEVTSDVVSYNLKQDVIKILEILDRGFSSTAEYYKLKPSMASDEFGDPKNNIILVRYMIMLKQNIEIFSSELQNLDNKFITNVKLDDIINYITKIENTAHPTEVLSLISNVIDKYFDNNKAITNSDNIDILRYEKLQNFIDNKKWLSTNKETIIFFQNKLLELNMLIMNTEFDLLNEKLSRTNNIMKNAKSMFTLDNWKNIKYENTINLELIKDSINSTVKEYNDKYYQSHSVSKHLKTDLLDMFNDYYNLPLLKSFEKIEFEGLETLANIENGLSKINICNYDLMNPNDVDIMEVYKILKCPSCGIMNEIISTNINLSAEKHDLVKKLDGLAGRYIDRVQELIEPEIVKLKYGRNETLVEFVESNYIYYLKSVRELIELINFDWNESSIEIIGLIELLSNIINEYLKSPVVAIIQNTHEISYKRLIRKIDKRIKLSGFNKMTLKEFKSEILKEIELIEKESDLEIEILVGDLDG